MNYIDLIIQEGIFFMFRFLLSFFVGLSIFFPCMGQAIDKRVLVDNYHLYKSNENALIAIETFSKFLNKDKFKKDPMSAAYPMCFYIALTNENPNLSDKIKAQSLTPEMKKIIQMGDENRQQFNMSLKNGYLGIEYPSDLDCLWGAYSATGDMKFPLIIQDYILEVRKDSKPDMKKYLIASAAEWSLKSKLKTDSSLDKSKFATFLLDERVKRPDEVANELLQLK